MKNVILIFLFSLFAFKSMAGELPKSIDGKAFIFQVVGQYDPDSNPNANSIYQMTFSSKTYRYFDLKKHTKEHGQYTYLRKKINDVFVGVISLKETDSGKPTFYHMVLVGTDHSGFYTYVQEYGAIKPDVRMNVARYYILPEKDQPYK